VTDLTGENGFSDEGSVSPVGPASVGVASGEVSYKGQNARDLTRLALELAGSPLDSLIVPGQTIFLKPNLIAPSHAERPDEWIQIVTHPSVIEAALEEVATRLKEGRIIIGDAPQTDSNFDDIRSRLGLDAMVQRAAARWPGIAVDVVDLRREWWIQRGGVTVERVALPGDPTGGTVVDLAGDSRFASHSNNRQYYGADYDYADTRAHHSGGRHEYMLSRSVLDADVFVNLPKLKTHKKTGVTLSLKNLVGINVDKNYLPHYSLGLPSAGGDESPDDGIKRRLESRLSRSFKRVVAASGGTAPIWGPIARRIGLRAFGSTSSVIRSGNWWGNDTAWRMCLDLNAILLQFDGRGERRSVAKPYVSIVDGIVGGEGDGPAAADPCDVGAIIAGIDPLAVDLVCTRLMGLDWEKIPLLKNASSLGPLPVTAVDASVVRARSNSKSLDGPVDRLEPLHHFRPHFGWRGHIELERRPNVRSAS
jgi:uncharacterized protein (DUF362 family)